MLKKFVKSVLCLFVIFSLCIGTGCSFIVSFDKEWLAEYVADAVADDDEEALWGVVSPATRKEMLSMANNNEKDAKKGLMAILKLSALAFALGEGANVDKLKNDDDLREKFAEALIKDGDMFVKIDGRWYLGGK